MKKLLVATDLDATLLDHQTYCYTPALTTIEQLKARAFPIIFNSSKTLVEQSQLRHELAIDDPFIIENGAAVVIPPGQLTHPATATTSAMQPFGPAYSDLIEKLHQLRQQRGYRFRGFADLSAAEIATMTGLSLDAAIAAKQRSGSEPLCWEDSEAAYQTFVADLATLGLQTTQGGRFRHIMAKTDKGTALTWLVEQYRLTFPQVDWWVVALGDSPNDLPMLQAADVGVLIPNPHRSPFAVTGVANLLTPSQPGPAGWAEALLSLMDRLE